jgi:hypothetical protein
MQELTCFIYSVKGYGSPPVRYLDWLEWRRHADQCK